jgi:alcohol dehydrogenase class IV
MNDFMFRMPTKVMFGVGMLKKVPDLCKEQGYSRIFIVTGSTSTRKSPHLQELLAAMAGLSMTTQVFSDVEADPSIETVDKGAMAMREFGADAVVAFGGGSPMDAAKSMSLVSANGGSIAEYMRAKKTFAKRGVPLICVPTTAGTGSEVTASAVTTDKVTKEKIGIGHDFQMPAYAIIDPLVQASMPPSVTAATGMDALTHAIEAYVALKANPISDGLALTAIRLIAENLRVACANGENVEARSNMALASLIAGVSFTNAGLGAVHGIAHPVGAQFGISHGLANGIILPYVMEYCLMANYPKFREIAIAMGEDVAGLTIRDAASYAVGAVEELKQDVGIPVALEEVGVPAEALESIVKDAVTFRLLPNSPRRLNADDLRIIVSQALGLL